MRRRRGQLPPEDLELWGRVVQTTRPLHSDQSLRRARVDLTASDPPKHGPPKHAASRPASGSFRPSPPPGRATAQDLAPPLPEHLAQKPVTMDKRKFQRMARGKIEPDARIDLHGMTLAQAHAALNGFILRAHASGARLVLVITGKGKSVADDGPIPRRPGALKQDVPKWLRMAPLGAVVLELREAHPRHGGSGAYYVYLRRARGS